MIAEIALGVVCVLQVMAHHKQTYDWREERRLIMNREYARSIPELATLQHITKPSNSDIAQAIKNGKAPAEHEPKAPSLPFGL